MKICLNNSENITNIVPLETVWELETQLLKEIVGICNKYSIEYYMWVGSALGAVKYGGIIPWDSDIDIAVPVNQMGQLFERLNELPSQYYVLSFEHGDSVIHPVVAVSKYDWRQVHVDVFPLYGISSDLQKQKHDYWRAYLMKILFIQKIDTNMSKGIKALLKKVFLSGITLKGIYEKFTKVLMQVSYNDAEYVTFPNGAYGIQAVVSKETIGAGKIVVFEGIQVRVPERIEEYLTQFFGDYTKDPEEFVKGR